MIAGLVGIALVALSVGGGFLLSARTGAEEMESAAARDAFVGASPMRLDDPSGDASDVATGDAATFAGCVAGSVLGGGCLPLPQAPSARAAEHLDIVSLSLVEETRDEVVLALGIARLEEGFAALAAPEGLHRVTTYGVCWYDADGACTRAAMLRVMRHGEMAHAEARLDAYAEDCNDWWWCSWTIPYEVRFGAPAEIVLRLPKEHAAVAGDLEAHHFDAWTSWADQATVFPMWHGGVTLHTPARHVHTHTPTPGAWGTGDVTLPLAAEVAFAAPASRAPLPLDAPLANGHGGAMHAHGSSYERPELDLVGYDLYEQDGGLTAVFALAGADAQPTFDFDYSLALGIPEGPVLEIGYRQERGHAVGYAGECIMEECQDAPRFEVPAEFVPGAPAFVLIHVPAEAWATLAGDVERGTRTTLSWVSAMATDGSQYVGTYEDAVWGDVHHAFMADEIVGGAPFEFGSGHRAPLEAFAVEHAH